MLNRSISDVLRGRFVVWLPPEATAQDAAKAMSARHVASVAVEGDGGRLVGIFTERDMLDRVVAPGRDPATTPLSAVMTRNPVTIDLRQSVQRALHEMKENDLRHLPVMEGDQVVGVVSIRDFISDEVAEVDHEFAARLTLWETLR